MWIFSCRRGHKIHNCVAGGLHVVIEHAKRRWKRFFRTYYLGKTMYEETCGQKGKENKSRYKEIITEKNHKAKTSINMDGSEFEQNAKGYTKQINI